MIEIKPQEGRQEQFLSSPADIVVYGGAAGGGKSWGLLIEPLRYANVKGFNGTIFRRTREQIRNPGALWDSASDIYSLLTNNLKEGALEIKYNNLKLKFSHLEYEKDKYNWDGSEVCYLGFDELQSFTETQFWYLVGRNRSLCGVKPYIRATCMADESSWVKKLIRWWLDKNGQFADKEKCGIIRWYVRVNDQIIWSDSFQALKKEYPDEFPKSLTFIYSDIYDNKILLQKDPGYLSNLNSLPLIERKRKKEGDWKVRPAAGMFFRKEYFEIVDTLPAERKVVRFWDRAATEKTPKNDPCWTAGVRMSRDLKGVYYIENVTRFRVTPGKRDEKIKNIASGEQSIMIGLEQEPGASGIAEISYLKKFLSGHSIKSVPARDKKIVRAGPFSSQAEAGNVKVLRGHWNDDYLTELENFDGDPKKKMDQVDASSGAFGLLQSSAVVVGSFNVPSPDVGKPRGVENMATDFRGTFSEGRKSLI